MNDNPAIHQFVLSDSKGKEHSYLVTEHPAGEGMELMYALLGLGAPAVGALAAAAMKSSDLIGAVARTMSGGDSGIGDTASLSKLAADLDLASVGTDIGKALGSGKAPELTRRILSRVHRDGKMVGGPAGCFDQAYQANYAELLLAVWKVCNINGFFPVPSMSSSSSLGTPAIGGQGSPVA